MMEGEMCECDSLLFFADGGGSPQCRSALRPGLVSPVVFTTAAGRARRLSVCSALKTMFFPLGNTHGSCVCETTHNVNLFVSRPRHTHTLKAARCA